MVVMRTMNDNEESGQQPHHAPPAAPTPTAAPTTTAAPTAPAAPAPKSKYQRQDNVRADIFTPRTYQVEMLDTALTRNTLVCMGTGTGKTFIAVMLINELAHEIRLPYDEGGKRTIFLVNSVPLVEQQAKAIEIHTNLKVGHYVGEMGVDMWTGNTWLQEFRNNHVLVMTAQIYLDILLHGFMPLSKVNLIVFDECHHACKSHPYAEIMKCFDICDVQTEPRILGLTASILNSKCSTPQELENKMRSLEKTLRSVAETASDMVTSDVYGAKPKEIILECERYDDKTGLVAQMEEELISALDFVTDYGATYNPVQEEEDPRKLPKTVLNECVTVLHQLGPWCAGKVATALRRQLDKIIEHVNMPKITRLLAQMASTKLRMVSAMVDFRYENHVRSLEDFRLYMSPRVLRLMEILLEFKPNDNFMIIGNSVPTVGGLDDFDDDDDESDDDDQDDDADDDNDNDSLNLSEEEDDDLPEGMPTASSEKPRGRKSQVQYVAVKRTEIDASKQRDENAMCGLIFVERRHTALALNKLIQELVNWEPDLFFIKSSHITGQGTSKSKGREAESLYKKQEDLLRRFRNRDLNLLVTTSVLEEGVDVPRCNLVVRFDLPGNFRSYIQSKGRARAATAKFYLLVDQGLTHEVRSNLMTFRGIEKILLMKCQSREDLSEEQCDEVREDDLLPDYMPQREDGAPRVTMTSAISLINRYCAKLPSDAFTHLTPKCRTVKKGSGDDDIMYESTLQFPINSPVKQPIKGVPMRRKKWAKMAVALKACEILHKAGELDDHFLPVGKEMVKYEDEEGEWEEQEASGQARPGTTKRKQYYYKKVADALVGRPRAGVPCYLYKVNMSLRYAITEEQNTRGRRIHRPEDSPRCFGILNEHELPTVPQFPVFTRSGEVTVSIDLVRPDMVVSQSELEHLYKFHQTVFSRVLRLEKDPMMFQPQEAECSYTVVPLNVDERTGELVIDWAFIISVENAPHLEKRKVNGKKPAADGQSQAQSSTKPQSPVEAQSSTETKSSTDAQSSNSSSIQEESSTTEKSSQVKDKSKENPSQSDRCAEESTQPKTPSLQPVQKSSEPKEKSAQSGMQLVKETADKKKPFVFNQSTFEDAVVMPSYRNIDQPQYFYVAEIRLDLHPNSSFPSPELYYTFKHYYESKYNLVITNTQQPLLDVDHTSARLNLLTPRYMNQKGVALPTSSAETRRARRENLQQKQILVPELCDVHPFPASLWRKAVCLPAILYRTNCLLISEEIRVWISEEARIGVVQPPSDHRFPQLEFGFNTQPSAALNNGSNAAQDNDSVTNQREPPTAQNNEVEAAQINESPTMNSADKSKCEQNGNQKKSSPDNHRIDSPRIETSQHSSSAENVDSPVYCASRDETIGANNTFNTGASNTALHNGVLGETVDGSSKLSTSQQVDTESVTEEEAMATAPSSPSSYCSARDVWDSPGNSPRKTPGGKSLGTTPGNSPRKSPPGKSLTSTQQSLVMNLGKSADKDKGKYSESSDVCLVNGVAEPKDDNVKNTDNLVIHKGNSASRVAENNLFNDDCDRTSDIGKNDNHSKNTDNAPTCAKSNDPALDSPVTSTPSGDDFLRSVFLTLNTDKNSCNIAQAESTATDNSLKSHRSGAENTNTGSINDCVEKGTENGAVEENTDGKNTRYDPGKTENNAEPENVPESSDDVVPEMTFKNDLEVVPEMTFDNDLDVDTFIGPSPCVILQTLTMSNANDFFNLERLETIGDSFLKLSITVYLYCSYPGIHEGKLSYLRSKQVSNYNLYRLGKKKGFPDRMVAAKFEPQENWLPPGYVIKKNNAYQGLNVIIASVKNKKRFRKQSNSEKAAVDNVMTSENVNDSRDAGNAVDAENSGEAVDSNIVKSARKEADDPSSTRNNVTKNGNVKRETSRESTPGSTENGGVIRPMTEVSKFERELLEATAHEEGVRSEDPDDERTLIPYNLQTQHSLPDKSIADCVEALIGCYLTTCGQRAALLFMTWIGLKAFPELEKTGSGTPAPRQRKSSPSPLVAPPSPLLTHVVKNAHSDLAHFLNGYEAFEHKIGYTFRDRSYLLQAFTHASYHYNRITDCYQRLEFLGDAILDYVITRHLFEDRRKHSPGILTDLRSALVNNNIFAALAVKWEFHKFFKALSPQLFTVIDKFVAFQKDRGDEVDVNEEFDVDEDQDEDGEDVEIPKALGDIFESVAGAIYLDSGMSLDTVWRVYYRLMKPQIDAYTEKIPKSPVRELLELEPETAKFEKPERTYSGKIRVTVNVVGKGRHRGVGRNYRIAKSAAAKRALKAIRLMEQQLAAHREACIPKFSLFSNNHHMMS